MKPSLLVDGRRLPTLARTGETLHVRQCDDILWHISHLKNNIPEEEEKEIFFKLIGEASFPAWAPLCFQLSCALTAAHCLAASAGSAFLYAPQRLHELRRRKAAYRVHTHTIYIILYYIYTLLLYIYTSSSQYRNVNSTVAVRKDKANSVHIFLWFSNVVRR